MKKPTLIEWATFGSMATICVIAGLMSLAVPAAAVVFMLWMVFG